MLVVVAFHAGLPLPGGFVGVDVFFVISGYVITSMLQREQLATGRIRFSRFYIRRFKRLTPALALMVSATMVLSLLVLSPFGPQQTAAKTGIGAMLLVANLVIARSTGGYFDAPAATNPLLNTWTLSVEEQFYLGFPALLAIGWFISTKTRLRHFAALLVGMVAVASFGLALIGWAGITVVDSPLLFGFYSPFARAWEFALGGLLALAARRLTLASSLFATCVGVLGVGLLAASLGLITATTIFPGPWTLLPVTGTLLLILAGGRPENFVSRTLARAPMVRIGDWSYSIYLWHWPLIVFASLIWPDRPLVVVAAAVASLVPAVASYRWVEQPIRNLGTLTRPRLARLVAATMAPALALAFGLGISAHEGHWSPTVKEFQASIGSWHAGLKADCDTSTPQDRRAPEACTWNASATGSPIYLVGDSNADQFSEGIIGAGQALGRPVVISTTNSCPFLDVWFAPKTRTKAWKESCRKYVQGTLEYLTSAPPGLVIIAATDTYWNDPNYVVGLTPATSTALSDEKIRVLEAGLDATLRQLKTAGQEVLLMQTTPKWIGDHRWSPTTCSTVSVLANHCREEMPIAAAAEAQGTVRSVLVSVGGATGATVLDSWTMLCPGLVCSTHADDLLRYRDEEHITVSQSEALTPAIQAAIEAIG